MYITSKPLNFDFTDKEIEKIKRVIAAMEKEVERLALQQQNNTKQEEEKHDRV